MTVCKRMTIVAMTAMMFLSMAATPTANFSQNTEFPAIIQTIELSAATTNLYETTASSLILRSGPGTNYSRITSMPKGTRLTISSTSGNWAKVTYNGRTGWASRTYLKQVSSASSDVKVYSKSRDGNTYLSRNFKVKEFACKDGSDTILIDKQLVDYCQKIRDHFGKPVTITSAYRTDSWNRKVGGVTNSYHKKGMAADIIVKGVSPKQVAAYAKSIGIKGVGTYNSFTHIDTRTTVSYWNG